MEKMISEEDDDYNNLIDVYNNNLGPGTKENISNKIKEYGDTTQELSGKLQKYQGTIEMISEYIEGTEN